VKIRSDNNACICGWRMQMRHADAGAVNKNHYLHMWMQIAFQGMQVRLITSSTFPLYIYIYKLNSQKRCCFGFGKFKTFMLC